MLWEVEGESVLSADTKLAIKQSPERLKDLEVNSSWRPDKISLWPFTHSLTSLHLLATDWSEQERPSKLVTTAD